MHKGSESRVQCKKTACSFMQFLSDFARFEASGHGSFI